MNEQELNERRAEWAGVKPSPVYPTGFDYPDFPNDLNACFERLVPNKKVSIVGVTFRYYPGGTEAVVTVQDEAGFTEIRGWVGNIEPKEYAYENSAPALCKAIDELIDSGKKGGK